jgi:hypothetical protein
VNLGFTPKVPTTSDPAKEFNLTLTPALEQAIAEANSSYPLHYIPTPEIVKGHNAALNYNPRCLTRDLAPAWSTLTSSDHLAHLLACNSMQCLEKRVDGWENGGLTTYDQQNTIHPAGHFSIGGLASDPYSSPGDPVWFLYHGMLDRAWSFWQMQDPDARVYQVGGTRTPLNGKNIS